MRITLNNSIELGNNFSFQIWGYYNSRSIFGLNETLPRGSLNLAIQKKLKSLTLTLNGNNLLDTEHWRFETNNPNGEFNQSFDLDFRPPQVKLSVIYNFGNQNLKAKKQAFLIKPKIRFAGKPGEQRIMFLQDPSGNAIEFKAFKNLDSLFES